MYSGRAICLYIFQGHKRSMGRKVAILAIVSLALLIGSGIVLNDWISIPAPSATLTPEVDRAASSFPEKDVSQWSRVLRSGQGALLSQDTSVLDFIAGNPFGLDARALESVSRFATAFRGPIKIQQQIPELHERAIKLKTLISTHDLGALIKSSDLRNDLVTQLEPTDATLINDLYDDELKDFVARLALTMSATGYAQTLLDSGNYADCRSFCDDILKQLSPNALPETRRNIEALEFQSREKEAWADIAPELNRSVVSNFSHVPKNDALRKQLEAYVANFDKEEHRRFREYYEEHLVRTKRILAWNDVFDEQHPELSSALTNPENPIALPHEEAGSAIIRIHSFYQQYPHDKDNQEFPEGRHGRKLANRILRHMFADESGKLPPHADELKDYRLISLKRSGTQYKGITKSTRDSNPNILELQEPETGMHHRIFVRAIKSTQKLPDYEDEKRYEDKYNLTRNLLLNFNWDTDTLRDFLSSCQSHGVQYKRVARSNSAEALFVIVTKCPSFQK